MCSANVFIVPFTVRNVHGRTELTRGNDDDMLISRIQFLTLCVGMTTTCLTFSTVSTYLHANFSFGLKIQFPRYYFTQALAAVILFVYKLYRPRASKVAAGVSRRLSSVLSSSDTVSPLKTQFVVVRFERTKLEGQHACMHSTYSPALSEK